MMQMKTISNIQSNFQVFKFLTSLMLIIFKLFYNLTCYKICPLTNIKQLLFFYYLLCDNINTTYFFDASTFKQYYKVVT